MNFFNLSEKKHRDSLSNDIDKIEKNMNLLRKNLAVFYVKEAHSPNFKVSKDDYLKTVQNIQLYKRRLHKIIGFLNQASDCIATNWQWTDEDDKK